jgi:hypothetical protein
MPETEFIYVMSEEEERAALAEVFTESEVAEVTQRAPAPYAPTVADLDAQAAADREQEQADRDYRKLARLALASGVGACRCSGPEKAPCLTCRVARWLALGL